VSGIARPLPSSENRLVGRRVLITGGGSGIGRASAERMAAEGAAVTVADIRPTLAEETAHEIVRCGGAARWTFCDVGDEESVRGATATAIEAMGGLDTLIANAGIVTGGVVHELSLRDWELVLRVNLTGVFLSAKHALPHIVEAGGGAVVTIGSVSSVVVGGGGSAASYKAAKGGVLQLTRQIAVEYAAAGVRANCVCPGAVETNILRHATDQVNELTTSSPSASAKVNVIPPLARRAVPSEIASVVAFLASNDSSFMTGTAVMVDGGLTAI
jgi:NAD(P)-dependent dehydrogenase (short-subunit alcohol dehydrogenase family)